MDMAYTTNPHLPRLRMEAVRMIRKGYGIRETARHFGYSHSAVMRWVREAEHIQSSAHTIPTHSSRPHRHPYTLSDEIVEHILNLREERNQCAEILHHRLTKEGVSVSLSSVKRVLKRYKMTRFSKWKKWHTYPPRPTLKLPGILVEMDTVHCEGMFVHTSIDVCSRCADGVPTVRSTTHASAYALAHVESLFPFPIQVLQTDHGSEFSRWFTQQCIHKGILHRHSRVRTPTDNGHVERFNRTLREECLNHIPHSLMSYRKEIPEFLHYYNHERPHMGLKMKTPVDILYEHGYKLLT